MTPKRGSPVSAKLLKIASDVLGRCKYSYAKRTEFCHVVWPQPPHGGPPPLPHPTKNHRGRVGNLHNLHCFAVCANARHIRASDFEQHATKMLYVTMISPPAFRNTTRISWMGHCTFFLHSARAKKNCSSRMQAQKKCYDPSRCASKICHR